MLDIKFGKSPEPAVSKEAEYTRNICRLMGYLFPKMIFDVSRLNLEKKRQLLSALFHLRTMKEQRDYDEHTGGIITVTNESVRNIIHNSGNAERS